MVTNMYTKETIITTQNINQIETAKSCCVLSKSSNQIESKGAAKCSG